VTVVTRVMVASIAGDLPGFQSGRNGGRLRPPRAVVEKFDTCRSDTPPWLESFSPRPRVWSRRSRCIGSPGSGSNC